MNSPLYIYTTISLSIHPWMDIGGLYILTVVNNIAMSIGVHTYFWIGVFIFFRQILRSRFAGSYDSFIFSFLRNFYSVFHIDCTNLQSHQPCKAVVMHWVLQIHWFIGQMHGHIGNYPMRKKKSFVTFRNWLCTIRLWYSFVFCCWVQVCCMNIPYLAYPSTCWWTLGCFQFLAVQNKDDMNKKFVHMYFVDIDILWTYIFITLLETIQAWNCWVIW